MSLKYKKVREHATGPTVTHVGEDIGYDFYAAEEVRIPCQSHRLVPLGVAIEIVVANQPMGGIFKDRSGMGKKGITHFGGCIDAGYRGELQVTLYNAGDVAHIVRRGDKVIQLVPQPVVTTTPEEVDTLSESARGEKGFGSSGN